MKLPKSFDDLIQQAQNKELYTKLVFQLNKDLLYANVDLEFAADILPKQLKVELHEEVYRLIQEKFADYLNLLYIIDVPEQAIKALDGSNLVLLSENVVFLILKREWQKVWFKAKYS